MKKRKNTKIVLLVILFFLLIGFLLPESMVIPVQNATKDSWNHKTFWAHPWGRSVVHAGIDIFASKGQPVISATHGIVLFKGILKKGGNVLIILGPKWRLHYYAHLNEFRTGILKIVSQGDIIATVGKTGNAINTPAHLHYSIVTIFPYPWRWDKDKRGWLKMLFLDPGKELLKNLKN